jgi:hypothetical protein
MASRQKRKRHRRQQQAAGVGDRELLPSGILGQDTSTPGRANLRLIRRAIRADWPIPTEKKKALVRHLSAVAIHCPHTWSRLAAIMALVEADLADTRACERLLAGLYKGNAV